MAWNSSKKVMNSKSYIMRAASNYLSKYDCHLAEILCKNECMLEFTSCSDSVYFLCSYRADDQRPCDLAFLSNYDFLCQENNALEHTIFTFEALEHLFFYCLPLHASFSSFA